MVFTFFGVIGTAESHQIRCDDTLAGINNNGDHFTINKFGIKPRLQFLLVNFKPFALCSLLFAGGYPPAAPGCKRWRTGKAHPFYVITCANFSLMISSASAMIQSRSSWQLGMSRINPMHCPAASTPFSIWPSSSMSLPTRPET